MHQLPVAFLTPGIERQLASGVALGWPILPAPLVIACQLGERHQRALVQPLAFEQHPFLEGRAVGEKKGGEKVAVIEVDRVLEPLRA